MSDRQTLWFRGSCRVRHVLRSKAPVELYARTYSHYGTPHVASSGALHASSEQSSRTNQTPFTSTRTSQSLHSPAAVTAAAAPIIRLTIAHEAVHPYWRLLSYRHFPRSRVMSNPPSSPSPSCREMPSSVSFPPPCSRSCSPPFFISPLPSLDFPSLSKERSASG